jgi:hypothetical protein
MTDSSMIVVACTHCHSMNVQKDAFASWDFEGQEWVLCSTFDDNTCGDCGESTHGEEITVPHKLCAEADEDEIQAYVHSLYETTFTPSTEK